MLTYIFLFIQLSFAIFTFFLVIAFVTGAPFVPSTNNAAISMIKLAKLKKGMKIYDLGSGEGKLLFLAAKQGATAIGLEINPFLALWTVLKAWFSPYRSSIRVYCQNFWKANLIDTDVVFVYLLPWRMEQLAKLLKTQLKPGALIVSNSFIFPEWKILRQDKDNHIYVFQINK